uniref:Neurotransmitter-gated ion-channel ligand-binding domain-containing protein n=2 Tax=Ditylum brightwellii TaxID=49249 RepID=A0A7S2E6E3_9STRA|mmetsp:Transcript_16130/g.23916  ORF Transcript_16130/g.23916 Transcript_16130/m.23916 type:complete len:534 (+) Transcript_16130:147-1748(+)
MKSLRTNLLVAILILSPFHASGDKIENEPDSSTISQTKRLRENTTDTCELCGLLGMTLLDDVYPKYTPTEGLPRAMNCAEIAEILQNTIDDASDTSCYDSWIDFNTQVPVFSQCCYSYSPVSTTVCEQEVQLLATGDDSDYNINIPPVPVNETAVNVALSIDYFAVTSIDIFEGTTEVFLGIFMRWKDERLAWDPKEHGGCAFTNYKASTDPELTNIWVPSLDLRNRFDSLQNLPAAEGTVLFDGTVIWRRFGGVKAICLFDGLERFPYDELACPFYFENSQTFTLYNFDFPEEVLRFTELEAGERKYQEFTVVPEHTRTNKRDQRLDIVFCFKRSSAFYVNKLIVPTILFTILTFGSFLLDQRVGERLGFGVSTLLVIVAQSILTIDLLPVTKERLWVNVLTQGSQYFAIAVVLQSLLVAYLYYTLVEPSDVDDNSNKSGSPTVETSGNDEEHVTLVNGCAENFDNENENMEGRNSFWSKVKNIHWTAESIKMMDRWAFFLFTISYFIFIVVMYTTRDRFGVYNPLLSCKGA